MRRGPDTSRLRWLDALRGIAVLAVVVEHLTYLVFRELRELAIVPWFDVGKYGVMVFFLVSGYIVPASLERHGSVRRFWVGRAFRLYPMLVLSVGLVLLLGVAGLTPLEPRVSHDPGTVLLAHGVFLQDLLGVQNVLNVLWTLSYEMVFYLLVTALFILGAHRRSAGIATGLAVSSVALAGLLPAVALSSDAASTRWTVLGAAVALAVGLACAMARRHGARLAGAGIAGGVAVALMLFNQRAGMWEGLVIVAAMFTGTTIYRTEHGQISRWRGTATIATVWALAGLSGWWNFDQWARVHGAAELAFQRSWTVAIGLTGATFAVAWLLRHRRTPRFLAWLGLISYSVYLMHTVVLAVFHHLFDGLRDTLGLAAQGGIAVVFFAVLLAVTWATHRYVEAPCQRFGRVVSLAVEGAAVTQTSSTARRLET